jgi:hypothetical protein
MSKLQRVLDTNLDNEQAVVRTAASHEAKSFQYKTPERPKCKEKENNNISQKDN